MNTVIKPKQNIKSIIEVPGDKSISHRSVMLGAIAKGDTVIDGFLMGADCLSTIDCFRKMGIAIEVEDGTVTVHGKGLHGLKEPENTLDVGNSGTTLRLMSGLLAAQEFTSHITGDSSIQKRPMDRVAYPLSLMGADIKGEGEKNCAPLTITGKALKGISYTLPVASAQVKSALILASLYAEGETVIEEPEATRDHTEIMLNEFGANIRRKGKRIICPPVAELYGKNITVPGDISSAAYFIAAGILCGNSSVTVRNVCVNPTRTGIIDVLLDMGAAITLQNERTVNGERVADITASSSRLHGTVIGGMLIPRLIDEIPVLAVTACFAEGTTVIKDAQELKVKESNRIKTVVSELKKLGADIEETEDGMVIHGPCGLIGAEVESYHDHRIAMALSVAALSGRSPVTIKDAECVDISFPNFYDRIRNL